MDGVYWTLGVEIVFYLLITAALLARVRLWSVGIGLGLLGSAFWILRAADFAFGGRFQTFFDSLVAPPAGALFLPHACFFGIGIAIWAISRDGISWQKALSLAIFLFAGCIAVFANGRATIAVEGGPAREALEPMLIWLSAVALVGLTVYYQPSIWRRAGRWGPAIRMTGLATYPLYLVHNEVGRAIMLYCGLAPWPALVIALATVIAAAFVIVKLEDWPRSVLRQLIGAGGRWKQIRTADLP